MMLLSEMARYTDLYMYYISAPMLHVCIKNCTILLKGFWNHVHYDHRKWYYIYYVLYVESIPENDRTALQKYVYKKVRHSE